MTQCIETPVRGQVRRQARRVARGVVMGIVATSLVACGGKPNADTIPTESASEFSAWVGSRSLDDVAEPRDLEGVAPPSSDTEEPIDLD